MVRVGINGFGRIGRMVFRAAQHDNDIDIVEINDLTDTKTLAHLLKRDSVHGTFDADVDFDETHLIVNGKRIQVYAQRDPEHIPWSAEIIVESTGFFRTRELASKHLTSGAKKVLISAPAKSDDVKTIVMGINEHSITSDDDILSNASCTTNCLTPILKVLNDNYGIEHGFFNTIHSYTGDQRHVDGPHKDLRRARACAVNIVPTTSGAAIAATQAIPALEGKISGMAVRVPTPDGSLTDFTCTLSQETTREEVNELFRNVSQHHLKHVLEYTEEPLVSTDIIGNPNSCVIDGLSTDVNGAHLRIIAWYDNEWGYSNRMVDILKLMK